MRRLDNQPVWYIALMIFSGLPLFLSIYQIFQMNWLGVTIIDNTYMYIMLAGYLSLVFVLYPAKGSAPHDRVPWYDICLFAICVAICIYFAAHGMKIRHSGWEYVAPWLPTLCSVLLCLLVLEAVRRVTDIAMLIMCIILTIFPMVAEYMPGFLAGPSYDPLTAARLFAMGMSGILGIPLYTVATLLIGFMLFGVVLMKTGGGEFFFKLAQSMLGTSRGGAAKISILASTFFGSISGSTVSNTLTTGAMTIPAMKRSGFSPHYAAAIEACASTGGPIMPPVMGAAAFIMASFLNVPYAFVVVGALIPALLYYLGLYVQVDAYAVKADLRGLPRAELPSFTQTLKEGWQYLFVIVVLVYLLLTLKLEERAPFYASATLLFLAACKKRSRLSLRKIVELIVDTGKVVVQLVAILAAAGMIIGGLSFTGVALSFSGEIVRMVGGHILPMLIVGAIASFILGLGMTITACYIFLAIVLVPGLVEFGIDPLAAHLFVFYWGVLSEITPPVALCVSAASGLAGSDFMKSGWTAMRLGAVKYIVPFFFAYNPALLTHGTAWEVTYTVFFAAVGVISLGSALEGYLIGVGIIKNWFVRAALFCGGLLTAFPEGYTTIVGVGVVLGVALIGYFMAAREAQRSPA